MWRDLREALRTCRVSVVGQMEDHMAKNANTQQPRIAELSEDELTRVAGGKGAIKDSDKLEYLVVTLTE
jgi:hypothetical protein